MVGSVPRLATSTLTRKPRDVIAETCAERFQGPSRRSAILVSAGGVVLLLGGCLGALLVGGVVVLGGGELVQVGLGLLSGGPEGVELAA